MELSGLSWYQMLHLEPKPNCTAGVVFQKACHSLQRLVWLQSPKGLHLFPPQWVCQMLRSASVFPTHPPRTPQGLARSLGLSNRDASIAVGTHCTAFLIRTYSMTAVWGVVFPGMELATLCPPERPSGIESPSP